MKKAVFIIIVLFSIIYTANSQELIQPSEGKSVVCFSVVYIEYLENDIFEYVSDKRQSIWIENPNYKIDVFDNEIYLGKHAVDHLYYECEPGSHLFWINPLSFIHAELLSNKVYIIYLVAQYVPPRLYSHSSVSPIHSSHFELLPAVSEIKKLGIQNIPDSIYVNLKKGYFLEISEVVPKKKRKIKKVNDLKRKSNILYNYKIRTKDTIPKIFPNMYVEVSKNVLAK